MHKITPFLAFKDRAEEAVNFYVSIFKNSKIVSLVRSSEDGPVAKGKVLHPSFVLDGQEFMAMDGGPYFSFSQGISLFVYCETQEEVDELWEKLSEGGEKIQCGWVKDKFGISWQIVPTALSEMMSNPQSGNSKKVFDELMKMKKIDIKTLRQAYERQ
jgi:predicted 3-demethylubiquinone-9 3-methyltransferase (glyoxalase superfamily)